MRTLTLLALVLTLFFVTHVHAQIKLACSQNGTLVTFSNGIDTSKGEAIHHLEKIAELLPVTEIDKQGIVDYMVTYNSSETVSLDLYESLLQKIADYYNISLVRAALKYTGIIYSVISMDVLLAQDLAATTGNILGRIDLSNQSNYQETMQEHLKIWKLAFDVKKQKIIAISHSQGGLFINDAYNTFMAGRSDKDRGLFAMLQVATPASRIAAVDKDGNTMGNYLTNDHDVIQIVPGALSANLIISPLYSLIVTFSEIIAHGFGSVYIEYFTPELQAKLKSVALLLRTNCTCENADGTSQLGYNYINPDGSAGGFVSYGAYISDNNGIKSYIDKDVIICNGATVFGSDLRGNIKISYNPNLVFGSNIYNATMRTYGSGTIELTNVVVYYKAIIEAANEGKIEIDQSILDGSDISIYGGNIRMSRVGLVNTTISGDAILFNLDFSYCNITAGIFSDKYSYPACSWRYNSQAGILML